MDWKYNTCWGSVISFNLSEPLHSSLTQDGEWVKKSSLVPF